MFYKLFSVEGVMRQIPFLFTPQRKTDVDPCRNQTNREILLLEPNYHNKYPPLGLMKISAYHKHLGDTVTFFKGQYSDFRPSTIFDRIYVTTLFTFYWQETIATIEFAKGIVKSLDGLYIGGIAASLIPELIAEETGLVVGKNILIGLLDKPGILDDNNIIIDEITPDYSILETINYHYPLDTGYLTYMSKGCTRQCKFCAVPKLEPTYKKRISIKEQIENIAKQHGERKDLILMDNNVLGSPRFADIIQEILTMGFTKEAKFSEPNQFMILTNYLLKNNNPYNEKKYLEKVFTLLTEFGNKRIKNTKAREQYKQLLQNRQLDLLTTYTKEAVLNSRNEINEYIEKYRNKAKKKRYVDFNQGLDCRYLTEEKIALLSKIPIRPMRISFDFLALEKNYKNAVILAAQHGIHELSNYMLYNYKDKPEEFWQRLKITNELKKQLKIDIYAFPMKYIPISGTNAKNRFFIGPNWCRKYLRAIQTILNPTNGIIPAATSTHFFEMAFGRTLDEFFKILMMPEPYIRYRHHFEQTGDTDSWFYQWQNLNSTELTEAERLIREQNFADVNHSSKAVINFMKHYQFRK